MTTAGTARPIGWMNLWPTRRGALWVLLVVLVLALLATLVWLAGRYEASQVQSRLERDAADASSDIRAALTRNVQNLQALQSQQQASAWSQEASTVLREHREMVRIERRDAQLNVLAAVDSPYQKPLFDRLARSATQSDVQIVCGVAKRLSGAAYSSSHFV
ncbi:MAG: PAS domain-containing sensor histidine kinase, partial [Burkholderiaceae bacterium]